MNDINHYTECFEEVFYNQPTITSDVYLEIWDKIDCIFDSIAGPLYLFMSGGNWDYVYPCNDSYWKDVHNIKDMLNWFEHNINICLKCLTRYVSVTLDEKNDKKEIRNKIQSAEVLIELAITIQLKHINVEEESRI